MRKLIKKIKKAKEHSESNPKYLGLDIISQIIEKGILYSSRKKQLEINIPDIWSYESVLYVGARGDRIDFGNHFVKNNYKIDVLEIFKPNIEYLRKVPWINQTIHGDIRTVNGNIRQKYDIVFWWHGPEHIEKQDLESTLKNIENLTNKIIICGCPWGKFEQGEIYDNPHEAHLSSIYPEDFQALGYNVSSIGKPDFPGSNILSWKRTKN